MVLREGALLVSDATRQVIWSIDPRTGATSVVAGRLDVRGSDDGDARTATFDTPHGLALDEHGDVLVGDTGSHAVRKLDSPSTALTTVKANIGGVWGVAYGGVSARSSQRFPRTLVIAVAPGGAIRLLGGAGRFGVRGRIDAVGEKSRFEDPRGIAFDAAKGELFVEPSTKGPQSRRIVVATREVTTWQAARRCTSTRMDRAKSHGSDGRSRSS